jgi:hypothetical protein
VVHGDRRFQAARAFLGLAARTPLTPTPLPL